MDVFNAFDHIINPSPTVQFLQIFGIKVFIGKEHLFMCDNGALVYSTGPVKNAFDCLVHILLENHKDKDKDDWFGK